MRIRLTEALKAIGAVANADWTTDPVLLRCVADSRKVSPGSLFCCIRGENSDGHDYVDKAMANGAAAILCSRKLPDKNIPQLIVKDVVFAMGKLARYWRDKTGACVIAITGTAGKTTLKDALGAILSQAGKTGCSQKNHNNQIGLPCSMLDLDGLEDFWVLEAGISHEGDMDELGAMINPDLAIIVNIGPGHEQGLGKKGVAWNKARLLKYARPGGNALISADYPELLQACEQYSLPKIFFSLQKKGKYYLKDMDAMTGEYAFVCDNREIIVKTPFRALYGAEIAGMATSCAAILGLPTTLIQKGFHNISLPEQRFQFLHVGKWRIIDDTYNANPLSMQRMLETAALFAAQNKLKLLPVLGEMAELGEKTPFWHHELGKELAKINPAAIFWTGACHDDVFAGYKENGGNRSFEYFSSEADFLKLMEQWLGQGDVLVIFKGSRLNKLENYLDALKKMLQADGEGNVL